MAKDGSSPAPCSSTVIMEVVVDLPCVPATATTVSSAIVAASASERCSTGSPAARAAASSGLSGRIAEPATTVWASPRLPAA